MHHNLKNMYIKLNNNSLIIELNKILNKEYFKVNINAFKFPEEPNKWLVVITLHFTKDQISEMVIYMKKQIDNLDNLNIDETFKEFNKEIVNFIISSQTKDTKRDSLFRPIWGFRDCLDTIEQNNNL